MAVRVEIECPHCGAGFTLNSRAPLGKQVPCPKCDATFVAREKALELRIEDSAAELEIVAEPRPRSRRKPPARRPPPPRDGVIEDYDDYDAAPTPRKRKSSGRGWKLPLIIGGSVLAVVVIGLTIWMLVRGSFSKKIDVAWLPRDAYHITVARYSRIWDSSIVQNSLDASAKRDIRTMKDEWGFEPKEIESVTTAQAAGDHLTVLRTHVDLDEDRIVGKAGSSERATHNGETYYRVGYGGRFMSAIYFPDSRTALSGSERSIQNAIDRGSGAEPWDDLEFIDGSHQIMLVYIRRGQPINAGRFGIASNRIKVNATGVNLSSSMETVWQLKFDSADDAKDYEEEVKDVAGRTAGPFGNYARSAVDRSIDRNGDVITTRLEVKPRKVFGITVFRPTTFGVASIATVAKQPERLFGMTWYTSMKRNANRRKLIEVDLRDFTGNGDAATAARNAVFNLRRLDLPRLHVDARRMRLYFDYYASVNTGEIRNRLRAAGFRNASVRYRGTQTVR